MIANLCAGAQNACVFGVPCCGLSDAGSTQDNRFYVLFGVPSWSKITANRALVHRMRVGLGCLLAVYLMPIACSTTGSMRCLEGVPAV